MIVERVRYGSRGQGSLIKYDASPYWFSCYYADGTEHRESTGCTDLKKAKTRHRRKLDELGSHRQGHAPVVTPAARRVTVAELLDAFEADLQLRELKSVRKVRSHAKPIRDYFGAMRAVAVTAAVVDQYIATRRAAGKSNATINRGVQVLGAAGKLAVRHGKLTRWPTLRKLSEAGNAKQGFFELHEFETVLGHLPDYLQDAARFAYACGWRKSEVVELRWEWVDRVAGQIVLPDSKNGRGRVLAIAGPMIEIIKRREHARLVETPDGRVRIAEHVFHRDGAPLGDFKKAWTTARIASGLAAYVADPSKKSGRRLVADKTFHDFRRTASRNLVRAGIREGVAMTVTGHKTRSVFDRYNITSTEAVRAALEAVQQPAETKRGENAESGTS
jgi:integrase